MANSPISHNPMNLPTWITVSRLLGLPFLLVTLHHPSASMRWLSLAIFLLVSLTDWLDGYLARKLDQVTELGKFLDPLVDKLLVLGVFLALIELGEVPAWGVVLILGRELAIAGWRVNPNLSGATIQGANIWGKLKTVTQISAIAFLIAPLPLVWDFPTLILFWLSVVLTLVSGVIYVLPQEMSKE